MEHSNVMDRGDEGFPQPAGIPPIRRRKKRTTTTTNTAPGSLSGLNRKSLRIVELTRGKCGYGFTISGQKPCHLRCIVEGSPAEAAGLRNGTCLIGVNNKDVSNWAHDEVVGFIADTPHFLRLHVAEPQFSGSSDDDSFQVQQPKPKYPHRPRSLSKSHLRSYNSGKYDPAVATTSTARRPYDRHDGPSTSHGVDWEQFPDRPSSLPRVEIPERRREGRREGKFDGFTGSSSGSSYRVGNQNSGRRTNRPTPNPQLTGEYLAVVGYVGSVDLPEIEEKRRLQALSLCIRRLRMENRLRSIVLLRIESNGISLFASCQNPDERPPLAFYSYDIISFCGAYSHDRRFFGLVTSVDPSKENSCHVFMAESQLLSHSEHVGRAGEFRFDCTPLPVPPNAHVLGLQECSEFPATADPILASILKLMRAAELERPPSQASNRLESTNSSNSDSGIGFRDESERTSGRIYDMLESLEEPPIRRSPVMRRRNPHKKSSPETRIPRGSPSFQNAPPRVSNPSCFFVDAEFQPDPKSLLDILDSGKKERKGAEQPQPIEVSVLVRTPVRRQSMDRLTPIQQNKNNPRVSLTRTGTRSLDNLCSPEIILNPIEGNLGTSTPALNQEPKKLEKVNSQFWEFKVPEPPKQKMNSIRSRIEKWGESVEILLDDPGGRHLFTDFLEREFSAENIHFYTECLRYKKEFPDRTQSQRISIASTIFSSYLQNGANEPVNVDFQARCQVEKALAQPTIDLFDLPRTQIFNLLKFDCYPRFLRSELLREYTAGVEKPLSELGDPSDSSDQESVKSHKLHSDSRRRSLLPWNIKHRGKNKLKTKSEIDGLNSDMSFIQRTAMNQKYDISDDESFKRLSYKYCRVILPDNSTTVLPCKPGESLLTVVERLLEKKGLHYSAFEVVSMANGKVLDLNLDASELNTKEVKVEPKSFIGIELPLGWRVGVRTSPARKLSEVLKPILSQHSLKLENTLVFDVESEELLDVKTTMGTVDGHNILVKLKSEGKLEEITNQVKSYESYPRTYLDDDQNSQKTSSSQGSSLFKEFLRRSSKKYKRKDKGGSQEFLGSQDKLDEVFHPRHPSSYDRFKEIPLNENSEPKTTDVASPLSLIPTELKLNESSRNRKPIYLRQSQPDSAKSTVVQGQISHTAGGISHLLRPGMSASAIFILDVKGKVLISRNYRGDIDMGVVEKFMPLLMEKEEEGNVTPILQTADATFAYIKHNNLYIVSITKMNANIALVFAFLHKLVQVMMEYFKELEEESIRDNFVIIYELLDELLDFGYPQTTDSKILQEFITQEGHKLEIAPRPPMAVTNAVSWRSEGIKYRKNEVFLDVIESVNLLANANGHILRSEIVGAIKMRVYLSGMPELRLGLNDKVLFESTGRGKSKSVELEDVKFHQCVRLSRFEVDRTISFIPPDGEFELMSYRLNTHVKPLIWIESVIERHAHSRVEYMVKAKSQFKRRSTANNVEIVIPVPGDADSPKFKTGIGSVKYAPEQAAIIWTIKSFPGGKEFLMRAHFGLPSVEGEDSEGRPPIHVKFEIPYFTTSGIQVRYLKIIEKSGYQALPWVRYITQNGDYQLRTN